MFLISMRHKQMIMIQNLAESQSVQSLSFDKVKKIVSKCEIGSPLQKKMGNIIFSNFFWRFSQTTSQEIEEKFLLPISCPFVNSIS